MRSVLQKVRSLLPALLTVVAATIAWQVLVGIFHIPPFILPPPSSILKLIVSSKIPWLYHAQITLSEVFIGYALAAVAGVSLAIAISFFPLLRSVAEPLIVAAQVIPKIALIPILFLWFGFDIVPRFVAVFLVCFFPIVISSTAGFATVDRDLVDLVRSYSNSRILLLRKILLPSALPNIFAGLRIGIVLAPGGAIIAEFIQSQAGLGFLISSGEATFNTTLVFAAVIVLVIFAFLLYAAVLIVERLAIPWSR